MKNTTTVRILSAILVIFVCSSTLYSKTYSILVGVEDYQTQDALNFAADDATLMYDILAKGQNKSTTILLLDKKATKRNIEKYMAKVAARITQQDMLIFYFTGHGSPQGVICHDGSSDYILSYDEIKSWLRKCDTPNKFIFLDSCSAANLFLSSQKDYNTLDAQLKNKTFNTHSSAIDDEQFALFLSSDVGQSSYELPHYKHGVFTFYLTRGLLGYADFNNDSHVTIEELYKYVRNKTYKLSKYFSKGTQCPLLIGNFDRNAVLTASN